MLQIKQIYKQYKTGNLVQKALDGVSLNLRDNEFVAILGPSGSGKTTLLNIIGGLDSYDSGDLVINGISTKKYFLPESYDWVRVPELQSDSPPNGSGQCGAGTYNLWCFQSGAPETGSQSTGAGRAWQAAA